MRINKAILFALTLCTLIGSQSAFSRCVLVAKDGIEEVIYNRGSTQIDQPPFVEIRYNDQGGSVSTTIFREIRVNEAKGCVVTTYSGHIGCQGSRTFTSDTGFTVLENCGRVPVSCNCESESD